MNTYTQVIDEVGGQDGWILAKFFFVCVYGLREKELAKKNEANIQPS